MDKPPGLERASWVAGIVGAVIAVATAMHWLEPEEAPAVEAAPAHEAAPAPAPSTVTPLPAQPVALGNCLFDATTTDALKKNGLYDELVYLCSTGKASTVGQGFRIPQLHPDQRFQYYNPAEFNQLNGLSDASMTRTALLQDIAQKLDQCFEASLERGASPHERIDLEILCIQQVGLKPQDKTHYMLYDNARTQNRYVST